MTHDPDGEDFYDNVPVFRGFANLTDESLYRPLPSDWLIGSADVVASTEAIRQNRYKAVNMAGAAVVAAITNALGREFPFVFGGDGASFAVAPQWSELARTALAETLCWAHEELSLELRGALVPVSDVRDQGFDVRIARFAPSDNVTYAMFTGGGLAWVEAMMKQGRFAVKPADPGSRPDLNGLSCRFQEMPAKHGLILAVLVVAGERTQAEDFRRLVNELVALVEENGHAPVPPGGPSFGWPTQGTNLEAHLTHRPGQSLFALRFRVLLKTLFYFVVMRLRLRVGKFVPALYLKQVFENSDFRKYDDALRMIIDCSPALADAIEARLQSAANEGVARFGLHREQAAIMTCFTPFPTRADHVHFIDGASGGYASAAIALKASTAISA